MSEKQREFAAEYTITFQGVVGDQTVQEKDGMVDLSSYQEKIMEQIREQVLKMDYHQLELVHNCARCGEPLDDAKGYQEAKFQCACDQNSPDKY